MHDPLAYGVMLEAWELFSTDSEVTLSPMSFVRWVREHYPQLARDLGEEKLVGFANEVVPKHSPG